MEVRRQLLPLVESRKRYGIAVTHRGYGKTVTIAQRLIRNSVLDGSGHGRRAFVSPLLVQAKRNAWDYFKNLASPLIRQKPNESELRIDFPNGARISLFGADNPEALRGMHLDEVAIDEFGDMKPRTWPVIILPTLQARKGRAVFIGTPKGQNEFSDLWNAAADDPEWDRFMVKASQSELFSPGDLHRLRNSMDEDEFAQEYECSFAAAIRGSFYGKLLNEAETAGRMLRIVYDPKIPVEHWWDFGKGSAMVVWLVQRLHSEIRVIDCLFGDELSHNEPLSWYAKKLLEKPYVYGEGSLPHDAEPETLITGTSYKDMLASFGLRGSIAPMLRVHEGIEAVKAVLPRVFWNTDSPQVRHGLTAMRQYQREWDDDRKVFRTTPLHDWCSHFADAFRTGVVNMREVPRVTANLDYAPRARAG